MLKSLWLLIPTKDEMRLSNLTILLFAVFACQAQVVDKTRLEYYEEKLSSPQMGMCISADSKLGAFLFANQKLIVFNLERSRLLKSLDVEFMDIGEIRFNKTGTEIILIERNRVRSINWSTGEVTMDENLIEEVVAGDISKDHLAVASLNQVIIWDMTQHRRLNAIDIKRNILTISFSPSENHIMVNPRYGLKNEVLIYDFESGKELKTFNQFFLGGYSLSGANIYAFQNKRMRRGVIPVLFEIPLSSSDNKRIIDDTYVKSSDIGYIFSLVSVADKLIGTGGYRGFSAYDLSLGRKVFTTKKTKRDRSASNFTPFRNYNGRTIYHLSQNHVVINAYGDNINQIYSASQNEIVGYLFADGNGDLAAVSRDGRFDGSGEASEKLYWSARNSSKKTNLESTFARGFTPNLLATLVNSDNEIVEFDIETEIATIPEIQIRAFGQQQVKENETTLSSDQKSGSITVEVVSDLANVSQVKLFQNSKLVSVEEKPSVASITFDVGLTNSAGEANYFYAVAAGKGGIDSEKQKIVVNYTGKTDAKPKLFLVTIGIDEYRNPKYNLNYAIADADAFEGAMASGASTVFESVNSLKIRNTQFTKQGILDVLEVVQKESKEQDMLVFYYAGHGVMSEGNQTEQDFFIVPHDVTQLYGRNDMLNQKAISATELKEASRKINAQKQVFILDACQSAAALDVVTQRGVAEERAIAQLARSTGTFWITATGSEQYATEFESLGHGVFTYALVEGLSGKADGGNLDSKVTVRELNAYLESRVPELAEEYKGTPQFPSGYSFGNDFPLVVYER